MYFIMFEIFLVKYILYTKTNIWLTDARDESFLTVPTYILIRLAHRRKSDWMNECLTTPQHEKQIGHWVS